MRKFFLSLCLTSLLSLSLFSYQIECPDGCLDEAENPEMHELAYVFYRALKKAGLTTENIFYRPTARIQWVYSPIECYGDVDDIVREYSKFSDTPGSNLTKTMLMMKMKMMVMQAFLTSMMKMTILIYSIIHTFYAHVHLHTPIYSYSMNIL